MEKISLSYAIEQKDFIRINIWAGLERTKFSGFLFNYGFYGVDAILVILALIAGMPPGYFIFIGLLSLFPLFIRLTVIRRAKKTFASSPIFRDHLVNMTIDENEICEIFYAKEYCNSWDEIMMISELKDIFVILVESIRVLYIPKSVLAGDDRAAFREIVLRKLNKKRIGRMKH